MLSFCTNFQFVVVVAAAAAAAAAAAKVAWGPKARLWAVAPQVGRRVGQRRLEPQHHWQQQQQQGEGSS